MCKACSRMPKKERESIEQKDEIFNFLRQSHISEKNITRLEQLLRSEDKKISELAGIVLEVAKVNPYKRRRLKVLARERRDLLEKLDEAAGYGEGPVVVIAETVKGKGVSFMENRWEWHGKPISPEERDRAIAELKGGMR